MIEKLRDDLILADVVFERLDPLHGQADERSLGHSCEAEDVFRWVAGAMGEVAEDVFLELEGFVGGVAFYDFDAAAGGRFEDGGIEAIFGGDLLDFGLGAVFVVNDFGVDDVRQEGWAAGVVGGALDGIGDHAAELDAVGGHALDVVEGEEFARHGRQGGGATGLATPERVVKMEHVFGGDALVGLSGFVGDDAVVFGRAHFVKLDAVEIFRISGFLLKVGDLVGGNEMEAGAGVVFVGPDELGEKLAMQADVPADEELGGVDVFDFASVEEAGVFPCLVIAIGGGAVEFAGAGGGFGPDAGGDFIEAEAVDHGADEADVVVEPVDFLADGLARVLGELELGVEGREIEIASEAVALGGLPSFVHGDHKVRAMREPWRWPKVGGAALIRTM